MFKSKLGVLLGILGVLWVMVDMLGIHWGALEYVAFECILGVL